MVTHRTISFAGLLKQLRIDAGLTQEGLAEAASLSPRSISDLERGINLTARKETARLLADALGLEGNARSQFEAAARGHAGYSLLGESNIPPGPVAGAATRTLPRDTANFTGREPELVRLMEALEADEAGGGVVGIHAIDGMAGIGKTTFAVHVAHQLAPRFPDGQIFLRLHGHTPGQPPTETADALATLLLTIGVPPQQIPADLEARAGLWRDRMAGRQALLVLDDTTGSEQVRLLLPGGAGTLVLITSRRRLTALSEALPVTLDILGASEAATLFVRLASRPGLRTSEDGVIGLVRLCGYLPLAISLMAGQLKHHRTWTATGLASDLASTQDRLAAMHAEEYSMAAVFDLSYRDLTDDQQKFFRRLGLQPGADIDAYAAANLGSIDLARAKVLLDDLYSHHLIEEPVRARYRFHDLIHEQARLLATKIEHADHAKAIDHLLGYYLCTARAADRHLARRTPAGLRGIAVPQPSYTPRLSTRGDAVTWMHTELLNLRAAVDYAALHNWPRYAVTIPIVMHGFLRTHGHWGQAIDLHQTALAAARDVGDQLGEAAALNDLGDILHLMGDYPAAVGSLNRALELYRDLGNRLGEANTISYLGLIQRLTGDNAAAVGSLTRALDLYRNLCDELGEAVALNDLGLVQYLIGDYEAASVSQNQSLALYLALRDGNGQASALTYLGAVQQAVGDYATAIASQERARQLFRDLEHPWGEANALNALGDLQCLTGNYVEAAASQQRALSVYSNLGYRNGEAQTLNSIGELSFALSSLAEAHRHHGQALAIARAITAPLEEARALEGIGNCYLQEGRISEATALLHQAITIYRRIDSPHAERVERSLNERAPDQTDEPLQPTALEGKNTP